MNGHRSLRSKRPAFRDRSCMSDTDVRHGGQVESILHPRGPRCCDSMRLLTEVLAMVYRLQRWLRPRRLP